MEIKNFIVESDYDKLPLACTMYLPSKNPKKIVQIVHGMCEYKERYDGFARFLVKNGYAVVLHDHRGHGASVKEETDLGWFNDRRGEAIVDDVVQITRALQGRFPGTPIVLFGHSMGSMVVRCFLQRHDKEIDKLIVCGSPSKNPFAGAGIFLDKCIGAFKGERYRSPLLAQLSTGNGDEKFPGEGKNAWLSRNKESVAAYNADPKCNFIFTCNGYENLFRLMKNTYKKSLYRVEKPELPVFFISGSDDPVAVSEEKWLQAQQFLRDVGYGRVSGKLYRGLRHEILLDVGHEEVFEDVLNFIEK